MKCKNCLSIFLCLIMFFTITKPLIYPHKFNNCSNALQCTSMSDNLQKNTRLRRKQNIRSAYSWEESIYTIIDILISIGFVSFLVQLEEFTLNKCVTNLKSEQVSDSTPPATQDLQKCDISLIPSKDINNNLSDKDCNTKQAAYSNIINIGLSDISECESTYTVNSLDSSFYILDPDKEPMSDGPRMISTLTNSDTN